MAYATQQQFIDIFGLEETIQLTNLEDPTATTVNSTVMAAALEQAADEMNPYLARRYALPFALVPGSLVGCNLDIARYLLDNNDTRENVIKRRDDRFAFLEDVAKGLVDLDVPADEEDETAGEVLVSAPERIFTSTTLHQFAGDI